MGVAVRQTVPEAVLDFRAADAAELGLCAGPAVRGQADDRYFPRPSQGCAAALARPTPRARRRRSRAISHGRDLSDARAGRVRNLLWAVLPDDDGRAVQPVRLA